MVDDIPEFETLVQPAVLQPTNLVPHDGDPLRVVEIPVGPCLLSPKGRDESESDWSSEIRYVDRSSEVDTNSSDLTRGPREDGVGSVRSV